jgi:ABC-2 type transport system ATP-binding protein
LIKVEGLGKRYGGRTALEDISFSISKGEIVGFLGPNGAGKTTTMNIIAGYSSATRGRVLIDGLDVLEHPMETKRRIGYLPEQPPLYNELTVDEYLAFVAELKKLPAGQRRQARDEALELSSLVEVRKRVIRNLSKGYRQRVGLAQALIAKPDILILDEPTVGLDPLQITEIRDLISRLGKDRTIILSSHILPEVSMVCKRVLIIAGGRIVADRTMDGIAGMEAGSGSVVVRVAANEEDTSRLLSSVPGIDRITFLGSFEVGSCDFRLDAEGGKDLRRELFAAFAASTLPLIGLRTANPSLEDVFLELTMKEAEA